MNLNMKIFMPILALSLLIACGQAPQKNTSNRNVEITNLERQIESLKSRLAKLKPRIAELQIELGAGSEPVVQRGYRSAPDIIEELMGIKMTASNRLAAQRRLSFLFESLAEHGDKAVPYIQDFLKQNGGC